MTMEGEKGTGYWKARAEALEAANRRLLERFLTLAAILPPEFLEVLEREPQPGETPRPAEPVVALGDGGPLLTPADVELDLRGLWARTAPPERD